VVLRQRQRQQATRRRGARGLERHPDKTFIGRIARGFDFLGYRFGPEGLSVAKATLGKFVDRALRLDEQGPGSPQAPPGLGGTCGVGCSG
jgi:hypothetical protein